MNLNGQFQLTLRDKDTGDVVQQSPWTKNNITDIWKMRSLVLTESTGTPAIALRGVSKAATGQYVADLGVGSFGVYAMSSPISLRGEDIIPPYVDETHQELADNVAFYNVNNKLAESAREMIASDNRSRYSYHASDASYTVRYIKNFGTATITGVCFGRDFATPHAHHGILLGEGAPVPSTSGTVDYFLEHKNDRTIVWKTVNASQQFSYDLLTKVIRTFNSTSLNTNIANAALTGGLVMCDMVVKAAQQASTTTALTVRLTGCLNFTSSTTVSTLDIVFDGIGLDTSRAARPVLVARPDINAFEVFVPMEIGAGGCVIKKVTVTNFDGGISNASKSEAITVATIPYVIGANDVVTVQSYLTGYFDVAKQRYFFPYRQYVNPGGSFVNVATANYNPGIIVSNSLNFVDGVYLARTENNFNAPCLTNEGILYCRANTTTMYYFQGSGVISGANFAQPYIKGEGNIMELAYKYWNE